MAATNWRTISVDHYDPESAQNFPLDSLAPSVTPVSTADVQSLASQVKQSLRSGDVQGALRGALDNAPYGGDAAAKVCCIIAGCLTVPRNYQCTWRHNENPWLTSRAWLRTSTRQPSSRFSSQPSSQI